MIDKDNKSGLRYPVNIIKFPMSRNNQERLHPTQKPVALLEYLIKTYTNENETVLDNCMGWSCQLSDIAKPFVKLEVASPVCTLFNIVAIPLDSFKYPTINK